MGNKKSRGEPEGLARGARPTLGAGLGGPAPGGRSRPMAPLRLSSGLRVLLGEILTLAFVPSNSENSFYDFSGTKNNIKQAIGTMASC